MIVNCFGIGAKTLCNDQNLVPIRGQVMKVSAPWEENFFLLDNDIYIIPGIETTLGGTRNYDNYDLNVDKHISAQIWENCTAVLPSLKGSAIIREWVGLRPHRIPIRLEPEIIEIDGEKIKVSPPRKHYTHNQTKTITSLQKEKVECSLGLRAPF